MKQSTPLIFPCVLFLLTFSFQMESCTGQRSTTTAKTPSGTAMPAGGKLVEGKPAGKGWTDLIASLQDWQAEKPYWELQDGILHGDYSGGPSHKYAYTKSVYSNFELNAVIKMTGKEANSGVCIRIHPTNTDNVPGYQVDMGPGYWGCLWEERRAGMVQQYPKELADKLVKEGDWNHYYIIADGHHIQAWLNGVKTIDTVHLAGFSDGNIGLQLCHGEKRTIVDVKTLSIRPLR